MYTIQTHSIRISRIGTVLVLFMLWLFFAPDAFAENRYWVGSSGGNTNDSANWSAAQNNCGVSGGASVPGSSDVAIFTSSCTNNVTINANLSLSALNILSGYTGTITQATGVTIATSLSSTTNGFTQADGVFLGGDGSITLTSGSLVLSGGSFRSTSGTLTIGRNLTFTGVAGDNFTHNSGTITFSSGTLNAALACDNAAFNSVTISRNTTYSLTVGADCTLPLGGTNPSSTSIIVNNGTIEVTGNWAITGSYTSNSGAVLSMTGNTLTTTINITLNGGTLPVGLTTLSVGGSLDNTGNILPNGLDITFPSSTASSTVTCGNATFNSVTINKSTSYSLTVGADCTLPLAGTNPTSTGSAIINNGTIEVTGNWTVDRAYTSNSGAVLSMTGNTLTTTRNLTLNGGTLPVGLTTLSVGGSLDNTGNILPNGLDVTFSLSTTSSNVTCGNATFNSVTISKGPTYSLTVGADCTLPLAGTNPTSTANTIINNGTIEVTGNWTVDRAYTSNSGAVLSMTGNTLTTIRNLTLNGGTLPAGLTTLIVGESLDNTGNVLPNGLDVTLNGTTSGTATCGNATFNSVTISKTSPYTLTVGADCTLPLAGTNPSSTGSIDNNGTIQVTGNWTLDGSFTANAGSVLTITGTTLTLTGASLSRGTLILNGGSFPQNITTISLTKTLNNTANLLPDGIALEFTSSYLGGELNCGDAVFGSIVVAKTSTSSTVSLLGNCTTGALTLSGSTFSNPDSAYTVYVSGNFSQTVNQTFGGANLTVEFNGSGNHTISKTTGTFASDLKVNKTGGAVSLATIFDTSAQICSVVEGVFALAGNAFTCGSTFTVEDGGTLRLNGSETPTVPVLDSGSTVEYVGTSGPYAIKNYDYHHLVINGAATTFNLPADIAAQGNLIISSGTLSATAENYTITLAGNWTNNGSFEANDGTVILNGSNSTLTSGCVVAGDCTGKSFYNLTINKSGSGNTVTMATNVLTVENTLTITQGNLVQGTLDIHVENTSGSGTAVSIAVNGTWSNTAGGDITLGANVVNAGSVSFDVSCGGDSVIIAAVESTSPGWSGAGSYLLRNVIISGQTASVSITVFGVDAGSNSGAWRFEEACPPKSFTISLWIYPKTSIASKAIIVKDGQYRMVTDATGAVLCQTSDEVSWAGATSTTTLALNEWQHVVCAYERNSRGITILVNGMSEAKATGLAYVEKAEDILLGRDGGLTYGDLIGIVDDVRIYNRTLNPREVAHISNWAPGPVGHWKMDENLSASSAGTAYDISGNANHLTSGRLTGNYPSSIPGKFGKAIDFTAGASDIYDHNRWLNITDASQNGALDVTGPMTIMGWVNLTGQTCSFNSTVIGKGRSAVSTNDTTQDGFRLGADCQGSSLAKGPRLFVSPDGTFTNLAYTSTRDIPALTTGTWYHFAGVYDGSELRVYLNGTLYVTPTAYSGGIFNNNSNFTIGGWQYDGGGDLVNDFPGKVDDVQIYNYALSSKQITNIMNARPVWASAVGSPMGSAVIHYKLDEGFGATTNNSGSGGSSLNGTITGATWTTEGKVGKALSFDGTGDYIQRADASAIDFSDGMTLSGWFYPQTSIATKALIVKDTAYRLVTDASGNPQCQIYASAAWQTAATSSVALTVDSWHHVLCAYDQAAGAIKIYVNGQETASQAQSNAINNSAANLRIGSDTSTTYGDYQGKADEIKLYNFGLSASEVLLDYNQGKGTSMGAVSTNADGTPSFSSDRSYCVPGDTATCDPPVAEWLFEEGSGTTANDTSVNSSTGSFVGTPEWTHGRVGSALAFEPSSYVAADAAASQMNTTNGTMSAWVKFDSTGDQKILGLGGSGIGSYGVYLDMNAGSNIRFLYRSSNGFNLTSTSYAASPGTWYHIVGTWSGGTLNQLYVNGVRQESNTPVEISGSFTYFKIGAMTNAFQTDTNFSGSIDQVRLYNYARTPAQIAWEYNRGAPVGHWKMDECSGTTINDWAPGSNRNSYRGNNGTLVLGESGQTSAGTCQTSAETAWYNGRTGKFGASLNFDGVDDYVTVADNNLLDFGANTSFSVAAWVYIPTGSDGRNIVTKGDNIGGGDGTWGFDHHATNNLNFFISPDDASWCTIKSTNALTKDTWHHVVAVVNRNGTCTTNDIVLYQNGKQLATSVIFSSANSNGNVDNNDPLYIGYKNASSYFQGQIDDVRIYTYPLTPHQIRDIMNLGAVRFE